MADDSYSAALPRAWHRGERSEHFPRALSNPRDPNLKKGEIEKRSSQKFSLKESGPLSQTRGLQLCSFDPHHQTIDVCRGKVHPATAS